MYRSVFSLVSHLTVSFRPTSRYLSGIPSELSKGQIASLKKMERRIEKEQERVNSIKKRNILTGLGLFGIAFAICK